MRTACKEKLEYQFFLEESFGCLTKIDFLQYYLGRGNYLGRGRNEVEGISSALLLYGEYVLTTVMHLLTPFLYLNNTTKQAILASSCGKATHSLPAGIESQLAAMKLLTDG